MKWFDINKYRPKHGTQIFVWDRKDNKQIHLYAFWDWDIQEKIPMPALIFPCWAYVFENEEPILIQPERSKREDSSIVFSCGCIFIPGCEFKHSEMRCSEHCGNTVRKAQ